MKQYKVVSVKYGTKSKSIETMEEAFNKLGQEGWEYKGQAGTGSFFIFEREV